MIKSSDLPAIVLAGGFGTRLRFAIGASQKAVAPIGEKSFLYHQLKNWSSQGVKEYIFLLHYKADSVISHLDDYISSEFPDLNYKYLIEKEPLGTGGSIRNALDHFKLETPFWVFNADTWVPNFVKFFSIQARGQLGVSKVSDARRYGTVEFNGKRIVTKFTEKSPLQGQGWVNIGVNLLHEENFKYCNERVFSLEEQILKPMVADRNLVAVPVTEEFIDIGVPADYKKFQDLVGAHDD